MFVSLGIVVIVIQWCISIVSANLCGTAQNVQFESRLGCWPHCNTVIGLVTQYIELCSDCKGAFASSNIHEGIVVDGLKRSIN